MFKVPAKNLPVSPGVYWYLKGSKVIYVGKAKNLKNRISSYNQLARIDPKTKLMLDQAERVKYQVLDSEVEAILTEAALIKLYQPRFNLIQRDDKSWVYLSFSREAYPRILITRRQGEFGPFKSVRLLRLILTRLRYIFPYCNASVSQKNRHQACFYFHLGLCPGACTGTITPEVYQKNIKQIKIFFNNKKKRLITALNREMKALAKDKDYQAAGVIKRQLELLDQFWQTRLMPLELPRLSSDQVKLELVKLIGFPVKRIETYDISNLSGTNPTGGMAVATNGRVDKSQYRLFNIKNLITPNDPQMMAEMISRRFNHPEWPWPDLIVVDGAVTQIKAAQRVLSAKKINCPIVGLAKKPDRLVFYDRKKVIIPLNINSSAGRLLIQLRDEAHRFGRKQHLYLRSKSLLP